MNYPDRGSPGSGQRRDPKTAGSPVRKPHLSTRRTQLHSSMIAPLTRTARRRIKQIKRIDWLKLARFYASRLRPIEVGSEPLMPPAAADAFRRALMNAKVYLEYGAGGSTVLASNYADLLVTVETDRRYLRATLREIGSRKARVRAIHATVGFVGLHGHPILPSQARSAERGQFYVSQPWNYLHDENAVPDLVLIDGRFRVAAALESLLRLPVGSDCVLLLDDFADRPHYRPVLEFSYRPTTIGPMLSFQRPPDLDLDRCSAMRDKHLGDWR